MLLIKNATLADPAGEMMQKGDVLLSDGKIAAIGSEDLHLPSDENLEILDASGLVLAPGLIDTHVHFRDPGYTAKEDIDTGATAAKRGGFTTVVMMASISNISAYAIKRIADSMSSGSTSAGAMSVSTTKRGFNSCL